MADPSIVAFGRYLKIVRERRKLSLEDVAHLTKAYPEPVNKGYLSRVERGLNHVGFSKMVALSRAYEVPLDAFGERYALDLEVDRLRNPPETAGKDTGQLIHHGIALKERGRRVHAFACVRDALSQADRPPLMPNYSGLDEQVAAITLAHGVYAVALGRYRLGLVEVESAERMSSLREEFVPIISYELSLIHRHLGDVPLARGYADRAIEQALRTEKQKYLGDAYSARAAIASREKDFKTSVSLYQSAIRAHERAGRREECVVALLGIANDYAEGGRLGAARRAIQSAQKLEREFGISRAARIEYQLGELEFAEGRSAKASSRWLAAVELAKENSDRYIHFKAEFRLFKLAVRNGNATVLNALGRRLSRLAPWMAPTEPDVAEFRELYARHRKPKQRGVARAQLDRSGR
jgi:tetratricopeptide (TPR) repeat protein